MIATVVATVMVWVIGVCGVAAMSDNRTIAVDQVMRSPLGRARGVGSGHSGVHHWYAERITSIALVPLTIWFIVSVLRLVGAAAADGGGLGRPSRSMRRCCSR